MKKGPWITIAALSILLVFQEIRISSLERSFLDAEGQIRSLAEDIGKLSAASMDNSTAIDTLAKAVTVLH